MVQGNYVISVSSKSWNPTNGEISAEVLTDTHLPKGQKKDACKQSSNTMQEVSMAVCRDVVVDVVTEVSHKIEYQL